jgi:hypothetical protein
LGDFFRNGKPNLRKIPRKPKPAPSHLDLIKQGGVPLRKLNGNQPRPPVPPGEDLLKKLSSIRQAVADSGDDGESSSSSSTAW